MIENEFKNKVILVTGGTGTIGSELVKQLLTFHPRQVRVISRDESRQYNLQESLSYPDNLRLFIGDIRDKDRLNLAFHDVDIIFHAAALKHVPFCEYNPFEVVKTNILGSQNVIDAALSNGVKKVIAISTDKSVSPSNVLGVSKLMMEKLFINANYYSGRTLTKFSCVRFGNVSWSRGSVLPLWKIQAEKEGVITVTDGKMTRFIMSQAQAINLVLKASLLTKGGEIFILKMPSIRLKDMAKIFVKKYFPGKKVRIKVIGNRGGEKTHEDLFDTNAKYKYLLENKEMLLIVPDLKIDPDLHTQELKREEKDYPGFKNVRTLKAFSSKNCANQILVKEII